MIDAIVGALVRVERKSSATLKAYEGWMLFDLFYSLIWRVRIEFRVNQNRFSTPEGSDKIKESNYKLSKKSKSLSVGIVYHFLWLNILLLCLS